MHLFMLIVIQHKMKKKKKMKKTIIKLLPVIVSTHTNMECAKAIRIFTYKNLGGLIFFCREHYENEAAPVIMFHSPFSSALELREMAELNGFAKTLIIRRPC